MGNLRFRDDAALDQPAVALSAFLDQSNATAVRLEREAGYAGELRAQGDVLVDQIREMRRCGFDSFVPDKPLDEAVVATTLARYDNVYQRAADTAVPVWKLRHG